MKKVLYFTLLVVVFASCTAKKGFVTKIAKQDIVDIQRFPVLSDIYALDKNDNGFVSDSLSSLSDQCIDNYLDRQNNICFGGNVVFDDSIVQQKVNNEIRKLAEIAYDNEEIAFVPIPPTIDSLMEAIGKRFGLLVYATGYERYESSFFGILTQAWYSTRGYANPKPYYEYFSNIALMIVDSEKNNIAFYNHSALKEKPSQQYCIDRHFMILYYRYWR